MLGLRMQTITIEQDAQNPKKKKGKIKNTPAISGKTISCHANVLQASGYQKKVERVKE